MTLVLARYVPRPPIGGVAGRLNVSSDVSFAATVQSNVRAKLASTMTQINCDFQESDEEQNQYRHQACYVRSRSNLEVPGKTLKLCAEVLATVRDHFASQKSEQMYGATIVFNIRTIQSNNSSEFALPYVPMKARLPSPHAKNQDSSRAFFRGRLCDVNDRSVSRNTQPAVLATVREGVTCIVSFRVNMLREPDHVGFDGQADDAIDQFLKRETLQYPAYFDERTNYSIEQKPFGGFVAYVDPFAPPIPPPLPPRPAVLVDVEDPLDDLDEELQRFEYDAREQRFEYDAREQRFEYDPRQQRLGRRYRSKRRASEGMLSDSPYSPSPSRVRSAPRATIVAVSPEWREVDGLPVVPIEQFYEAWDEMPEPEPESYIYPNPDDPSLGKQRPTTIASVSTQSHLLMSHPHELHDFREMYTARQIEAYVSTSPKLVQKRLNKFFNRAVNFVKSVSYLHKSEELLSLGENQYVRNEKMVNPTQQQYAAAFELAKAQLRRVQSVYEEYQGSFLDETTLQSLKPSMRQSVNRQILETDSLLNDLLEIRFKANYMRMYWFVHYAHSAWTRANAMIQFEQQEQVDARVRDDMVLELTHWENMFKLLFEEDVKERLKSYQTTRLRQPLPHELDLKVNLAVHIKQLMDYCDRIFGETDAEPQESWFDSYLRFSANKIAILLHKRRVEASDFIGVYETSLGNPSVSPVKNVRLTIGNRMVSQHEGSPVHNYLFTPALKRQGTRVVRSAERQRRADKRPYVFNSSAALSPKSNNGTPLTDPSVQVSTSSIFRPVPGTTRYVRPIRDISSPYVPPFSRSTSVQSEQHRQHEEMRDDHSHEIAQVIAEMEDRSRQYEIDMALLVNASPFAKNDPRNPAYYKDMDYLTIERTPGYVGAFDRESISSTIVDSEHISAEAYYNKYPYAMRQIHLIAMSRLNGKLERLRSKESGTKPSSPSSSSSSSSSSYSVLSTNNARDVPVYDAPKLSQTPSISAAPPTAMSTNLQNEYSNMSLDEIRGLPEYYPPGLRMTVGTLPGEVDQSVYDQEYPYAAREMQLELELEPRLLQPPARTNRYELTPLRGPSEPAPTTVPPAVIATPTYLRMSSMEQLFDLGTPISAQNATQAQPFFEGVDSRRG